MVDGSLPQMSLPFVTAKQQENICSELPFLHSSSLELLIAIIKSMGRYNYTISFLSLQKKKKTEAKQKNVWLG